MTAVELLTKINLLLEGKRPGINISEVHKIVQNIQGDVEQKVEFSLFVTIKVGMKSSGRDARPDIKEFGYSFCESYDRLWQLFEGDYKAFAAQETK